MQKNRSKPVEQEEEEEVDLDSVFAQYFSNPQMIPTAVIVLANAEMALDGVTKNICPFKNNGKKKDFEAQSFNYKHYRLREEDADIEPADPDESREMRMRPEDGFVGKFKEQFAEQLDKLDTPIKSLLETGIQDKLTSFLFELKAKCMAEDEKAPSESKAAYLEKFIEKIVEKQNKDNEEGVAEKIVKYGGIEPVLTTDLFQSDMGFRKKFKTILYNCKTFNELKKYGGKDITEEREKLTKSIFACLIGLRFNEQTAQQICDELLHRPLSNIVALRSDLTNQQKTDYYNSEFYRSGELKHYALISDYQDSLESKVKEEVSSILALIEGTVRLSKEILDAVLSFNLYAIMKISTIRHIKKSIYQHITEKCPTFFNAFRLIRDQNKSPASLRENESIAQKMDLIDLFLKINLPFQEWQLAESRILARDYGVVEEVTLKFQAKHRLMQHIMDNVEPYFHSLEKLPYRSEVEYALLRELMSTEIGESIKLQEILLIIGQLLQKYESSQILEYTKGQQRAFNDVLKKCEPFKEYKANKGRDVKEEEYSSRCKLRKQIYEINKEDRIDVPYESINAFIDEVVAKAGKIPKNYKTYITNLSKLAGEPIEPIIDDEDAPSEPLPEEENIGPSSSDPIPLKPKEQNKEELARELAAIAERLVSDYIKDNEDSLFEKAYTENFQKKPVDFVKRIVEQKAFQSEASAFFADLKYNNLLTRRIKAEFLKNAPTVSTDLERCAIILEKLSSPSEGRQEESPLKAPSKGSPSPVKSPIQEAPSPTIKVNVAQLQEEFKTGATAFVSAYTKANEDSLLEKALIEKYEKSPVELVRAIIKQNAFGDTNSKFFSDLKFNNLLTRRIKAEFGNNLGLASTLKRCTEIMQQI